MNFVFDAYALGHLIATSVRAALAEHGIEMTERDEEVAGEAAGQFLNRAHAAQQERVALVESVGRDLAALPTTPAPQTQHDLRNLGIDPPV